MEHFTHFLYHAKKLINSNSSKIRKFNKSCCHNSHERDYNEIKALEYGGNIKCHDGERFLEATFFFFLLFP